MSISRAKEAFESFRSSYGPTNCFLLRINSRPPGVDNNEHLPDPWSQFLSDKINPKNYSTTAESSPDPQRPNNSFEVGLEANEGRSLNYHPLSPEVEDVLVFLSLLYSKSMVNYHGYRVI